MGTQQYRNAAGERLPSVTTVCKLLSIGGNEGLLYWANQLGLEGKTLEDGRATAADVGTYAHLGIEAQIKGQPWDIDALHLEEKQAALVRACLMEWARWREQAKIEFLASEVPLVSEAHQYGGTLDAVVRVGGKKGPRAILDLKTGGGIYAEHLMQVRAYGELWQEAKGEPIDEYHLIRVGKLDASWHHHSWRADSEAVELAWELFRAALLARPGALRLAKLVK